MTEPLQALEQRPEFQRLAAAFNVTGTEATGNLSAAIGQLAADTLLDIAGEFIEQVDAGVIELAKQHRDAETLGVIRRIQAAVYRVYDVAGKR